MRMAMTNITRIRTAKVADVVFNQMKECIASGTWKAGEKIPSEADLSDVFGVSRVSVRNAIQRLVGMGLLTIKRGDGTYVSTVGAADYAETLLPILMIDRPDLLSILEFRQLVEPALVSLVVNRCSHEDIEFLRSTLEEMREASMENDYKRFSENDLAFHMHIATATGNDLVEKIFHIVNDVLSYGMDNVVSIVGLADGLFYHEKIIEAIEKKDAELASKCMAEHLSNAVKKASVTQKSQGEA